MKQLTDAMRQRVRQRYENQSFLRLLGIQLDEIHYGQVTMSCELREELTQQQGFVHGGVLSTIADVSCGYAALTTMDETSEVLTVEFKMNILRASSSPKVFAHAQVIKAGKTLVVVESTITDLEQNVLAKMLSTMFRSQLRI